MAKKKNKTQFKFEFGIDFQEAILGFIVSSKIGYKSMEMVQDGYFVLVTHSIIYKALDKFWKDKKRIPSKEILNEKLRQLYNYKEYDRLIRDEDKTDISQIVDRMYSRPVKDEDEIFSSLISFARYTALKNLQEEHDLQDFDSYDSYSTKVAKAINLGSQLNEDKGEFLVSGARDRIYKRGMGLEVKPLPFWQLNRTLNAGGVEKGTVIMIMAEQKRFKTGMAINWGRLELRRKGVGFYVDLENGQLAIATRGDQGMIKASKRQVLEGQFDDKMAKLYRKYKRIGSELVIKRFPAYKTTIHHIKAWLDRLRLEDGLIFNFGIIDYGDLGAATTGRVEDDKRISDFYIDMKNLAQEENLDYILTLSHVKRDKDTLKRKATVYQSADVAKAIDKTRHADMILGLQENDEEKEAGVMRLEVVDQRDGSTGRVMLWVDIEKQSAREFTQREVDEYYKELGKNEDGTNKKAEKDADI